MTKARIIMTTKRMIIKSRKNRIISRKVSFDSRISGEGLVSLELFWFIAYYEQLEIFSVTTLKFFPTSTWTGSIFWNLRPIDVFRRCCRCWCIIDSNHANTCIIIFSWMIVSVRCVDEDICWSRGVKLGHSSFDIIITKCRFKIDTINGIARFCGQESFCHTESNIIDEIDECFIGSFLVDYQRIFLCISFKRYFFAQVRHTIDMLHPEFVDRGECQS